MNTTTRKKPAPIRGLLQYTYHSVVGSLGLVILLSFVMGLTLLYTGSSLIFTFFRGISIIGPPYVILMNMGGGKYGKWERFLITLPIRRADLVISQYVSMILASVIGLPIVVLITGLSFTLHEALFTYSLMVSFLDILSLIAVPLLMIGLLFPISCTKYGEDKQEGLTFVCFLVAFVIPVLISALGVRVGLPEGVTSVVTFSVALMIFGGSYIITRNIYRTLDF